MGKFNINRNKIEQFLQWEGGQRLFNFAYSMGAAIVILGALFKILHMTGGNTLLMIGMGTEVIMFILTAFDRPPKEYHWEEVYPQLADKSDDNVEKVLAEGEAEEAEGAAISGVSGGGTIIIGGGGSGVAAPGAGIGGGTVVLGGGAPVAQAQPPAGELVTPEDAHTLSDAISRISRATEQLEQMADLSEATHNYMIQMAGISDQLHRLNDNTQALNAVSQVLLDSYRSITENSENITRSSGGYVREMEALNKNVSGLNTIYEIQLRSISGQLDSIDRVNRGIQDIRDMYERSASQSARYAEETERMAHHMQQLNRIYENMIQAMTVNMYRPMGPMPTPPATPLDDAPEQNS
ncbi:MAG: gliding motility protein GldL [Muribaculaceae bacterium]|nr:gliding motility protein GldL [Muribaculaceae bacterium]